MNTSDSNDLQLSLVAISLLAIGSLILQHFGIVAETWTRPAVFALLTVFSVSIYNQNLVASSELKVVLTRRQFKYAWYGLIATSILVVDYLLLRYFNTLIWPYLWPHPAIFILLAGLILAVSFYQQLRTIWAFRIAGVFMIFIGQSYILHSLQVTLTHFSLASVLHLIGILGTSFVMFLNYFNQFRPKDNRQAPRLPANLPHVASVIPTYNEPLPVLERTILSLKQLDYPADRLHVVVSDDGHRTEVRQLAYSYGVHYNAGARRDAKAGNLNSALNYLAQNCPEATLVLTQDADEVIDSTFLQKTTGYFVDPKMAFVQTPKEALTPKGDPFGTRDRLFYDRIQTGRNGCGAAFSCGSGVIWSIAAVQAVGGFSTWNLVEDLTTSFLLHSAGYRSEYHNELLSIGLAPDDIPNLLKQRGTWAADTWRLFLFKNPLRQPGLSLRQRLQYLELCLFYVTAVFFIPLLMLVPVLSLASGNFLPIQGAALFPWMAISFIYYASLSRSQGHYLLRMWQYWLAHWPTYTKAFWIALHSRRQKPQYKVTRKTRQNGFHGYLLWPQFLYIVIGAVVSLRALFWMPELDRLATLSNVAMFAFFAFMLGGICQAAFYSVKFPLIPPLGGLLRRGSLPQNPSLGKSRLERVRQIRLVPAYGAILSIVLLLGLSLVGVNAVQHEGLHKSKSFQVKHSLPGYNVEHESLDVTLQGPATVEVDASVASSRAKPALAIEPTATTTTTTASPTPTPELTATPTTTPIITPEASATSLPALPSATLPEPEWLRYLNQFRRETDLPLLVENSEWSEGSQLHSIYMVKTDLVRHAEISASPWYTEAGALAAESGILFADPWEAVSLESMINYWISTPFSLVPVIDPELYAVGFGLYREALGKVRVAATLDVKQGLGTLPATVIYPLPFPRDGGQTWILKSVFPERPQPLTSCPGYARVTGPPIILQIGPGDQTPQVTEHTFRRGETELEHCIFDETTYVNPAPALQERGRLILDQRDAIVLIPRAPLQAGQSYTVNVVVNGVPFGWSFTAVR